MNNGHIKLKDITFNLLKILNIILFFVMHSIVRDQDIRKPLFFITLLFSLFLFTLFAFINKGKKKLSAIPIIIFIICIIFYKSVYRL